ncbi:hypothetical protein RvY_12420 [Ramazzottius varieornatus]|uniref:Uncharacterized protein n=1 Tax=Ramazzottius varieornatus TaxID=947166 RepID=A0A1D1VLG2_RAMVA|nr:hypothetical protein RvY_12420 [Ramazzottius varieornatus]
MVVLSKQTQDWLQHVTASDIKVCVLGLTLTTDSPKLLWLTVTCGLVSVGLISGRSRSFLLKVWRQTCAYVSRLLYPPLPTELPPPTACANRQRGSTSGLPLLKMGQKMTVITSVQLDTDPEVDQILMSSYEVVDRPRLRPAMKDAQTSPLTIQHLDVGINTIVSRKSRGCSPLSVGELSDHDELLLIFGEASGNGEGGINGGTSGSFLDGGQGDHSELYEKLEKIQKQLQEANQEMDQTMNRMAELSQKHFYAQESPYMPAEEEASSQLDYGHVLDKLRAIQGGAWERQPAAQSSADSAHNGLIWEDEFAGPPLGTNCAIKPVRYSLDNLTLWQSELGLYSNLHTPHNRYSLPPQSSFNSTPMPKNLFPTPVCTPSPILSPVQPAAHSNNNKHCLQCLLEAGDFDKATEKSEGKPERPLSAPGRSSYSSLSSTCCGASVSCDCCMSSASSPLHCPSHGHTCRSVPLGSPPAHRSPLHDRVPKMKQPQQQPA